MPIHKYRYCTHVCIYITIIKVDKVVYLRKMGDMEVGVEKYGSPVLIKFSKTKMKLNVMFWQVLLVN